MMVGISYIVINVLVNVIVFNDSCFVKEVFDIVING